MESVASKPNLFGLDRAALREIVAGRGEPAYRAEQIYSWLYRRRARTIAEMTDLAKGIRDALAAAYDLRWPEVVERGHSQDGTIKYLFRLDDGATVESVYIPEERRRTICISTQAGCPLQCAFCLTGISGYKRNLKPWEILGQVATVMHEIREGGFRGGRERPSQSRVSAPPEIRKPWNVVVMGMGEPLLNYDNTVVALRALMDPDGFGVAPKKLTLSTVGILPALEKLMQEPVRPNLAISLHAPTKELRLELMPIEERYDIKDVIAAAQRYPIPRGGAVTYEYVLLGGVNDQPAHARALVRLLAGSHGKVNLIPLNPAPEIPFAPPTPESVDEFCRILSEARVPVSVRRPRGQDILAACGQLHLPRGAVPVP
ncbi:MAG TPA: 23S rRNA (adenine(2503)-C(2))-methyltransferase RlmN, partial [Vicinamibacteria bacterium]|nr:23S rRNA (adenine(2503)-C(2))-methyltransferase RlmN [Vicinamibacteria bacterium]